MSTEIIRILVPNNDQGINAISMALSYANTVCELKKSEDQEVVIFAPGKASLKFTTLSAALGEKNAKTLHDGGHVVLPSGIRMRAETIRTLKWLNKPSIIISVYSDQKMLDQIDSTKNVIGIIAVPHAPDALKAWQLTWSPIEHGAAAEQPAKKLLNDPLFEQALVSLTACINLSHQVLHPSDKESTEQTLRILRAKGHKEEPENIRSWAIKHSWHPKAADELEKLAQRILSLTSKPKLPNPELAQRKYDYWRSKT
jgi:hypothetical protein